MYRCLELAVRGAGRVSPNPMVGAVLVGSDGTVLGEGWHQAFGGPHAEVHAVKAAEKKYGVQALQEATLYVNLEPCNHHGKTPPCTDLVLQKKIPRVVVGMEDPFPETAGKGLRRLKARGVEVTQGVLGKASRRLNESYLHHLETGRPLVTVKVAQTLDGAIATAAGDARWISGKDSRMLVHRWRAITDAVMVGEGTARADDPRLTVRHVDGQQPLRIVLDRTGKLPVTLNLFSDGFAGQTVAAVGKSTEPQYRKTLEQHGGSVVQVAEVNGHLDLKELLNTLGQRHTPTGRPVQSLLVEAGTGLATALFQQQLIDRYFLFVAPKLLGGGKPAVADLGIRKMDQAVRFAEAAWQPVGQDVLFCGYRHSLA